jgi:predicted site-specific integrase-resolvase
LPGRLLRRGEAQEYVGVSEHVFAEFIRDGLVRPVRLPRGGSRFRLADLDAFVERHAG